jgi:hypothetical protein
LHGKPSGRFHPSPTFGMICHWISVVNSVL